MKLNVQWLKEILPAIPANNKLCDKLTSIGLEVADFKQTRSGSVIDLDITPNRADCLSVYGVARDLSAAYKKRLLKPKTDVLKLKNSIDVVKAVNKLISPHYTCLQIKDINNKIKTPLTIKNRLTSCGITSINLIVDILNYVMLELGQPFHAFNEECLDGKLNVRLSKKNETINGLNDKKYILEKNTPVITDNSKIHAIAGIIGSKDSSVTTSAKNIIIECAYFTPQLIRSASKSYRVQTDSSYRFERGVDPLQHQYVLSRVMYLIKKYTTYKSVNMFNFIDKKIKAYKKNKIYFDVKQVDRILGQNISTSEIKNIFKFLGFDTRSSKNQMVVNIPSYRFDIENEYDLIEEIARIIGYDEFTPQMPSSGYLNKDVKKDIDYSNKLSSSLVFRGYNEIKSYSFLPKLYQERFVSKKSIINIQNPISEDKTQMRTSLIPGLVKTYKYNSNRQQSNLKIFEIGKVYERNNKGLIKENNYAAGLIAGENSDLSLKIDSNPMNFFDLKGDLISMIPDVEFKHSTKCKFLNENVQAGIFQNKKQIGFCGEVSDLLCIDESIDNKIYAFEILLNFRLFPESVTFMKVSQFPKTKRDLTILVDDKILGKDIIDIITKQSYKYLINIKINDVFYNNKFDTTKKSISLEFQFQNRNATLVDTDVNLQMNEILKLLQKHLDAQLRT